MIADFATQMVEPPRVRCIGVDLQPYSLGHHLLLRATGNRFVSGEFPAYEDLIAAAFICAHTWEENQKLLRSPWRRWLRVKVWGCLAGKFNVATQTVLLYSHIQQASKIPETKRMRGGGRELISEWDTRLFCYLRSIGYSESEALNMPLVRANLLFVAHIEETGLMEFKSRSAFAREDRMRAIVEEMERDEQKGFAT